MWKSSLLLAGSVTLFEKYNLCRHTNINNLRIIVRRRCQSIRFECKQRFHFICISLCSRRLHTKPCFAYCFCCCFCCSLDVRSWLPPRKFIRCPVAIGCCGIQCAASVHWRRGSFTIRFNKGYNVIEEEQVQWNDCSIGFIRCFFLRRQLEVRNVNTWEQEVDTGVE